MDVLNRPAGQVQEHGKAEILVRVQDVHEVVRHGGAVFRRGFGRADVHVPVYLPAVGVDDLAVEGAGQIHRQGTLAHGGGADYEENRQVGLGHFLP